MKRMTLSEYLAVPENYRGVWTTERWDTQKDEKNNTERISRSPGGLPGSMDYRTMGHSRLGDQKKKPHGKTYPDGI